MCGLYVDKWVTDCFYMLGKKVVGCFSAKTVGGMVSTQVLTFGWPWSLNRCVAGQALSSSDLRQSGS
jgi:hypothetical protein